MAMIFEPFTQADAGATRQFDGLGIGLAHTRKIARLLGGDVDAQSEPGEGSTFTLRVLLEAGEGERLRAAS